MIGLLKHNEGLKSFKKLYCNSKAVWSAKNLKFQKAVCILFNEKSHNCQVQVGLFHKYLYIILHHWLNDRKRSIFYGEIGVTANLLNFKLEFLKTKKMDVWLFYSTATNCQNMENNII